MTWEVIDAYTRAQALEDGVLVAVPDKLAREAGFKWPVALTAAAWGDTVEVPDGVEGYGQSVTGRLWDVLCLLQVTIRQEHCTGEFLAFSVRVLTAPDQWERVHLYAHAGPGDDAEPVITVGYLSDF